MDDLLEALNDYFGSEYGESIDSIPENGIIELAYTDEYNFDDEDDYHDIQVSFDINNLKWLNYIDGKLVLEQPRSSIDEFIEELYACNFNDIIRDCVNVGYDMYGA